MELEEALGLKKGTKVKASMSWVTSGKEVFSEGKDYLLEGDAVTVYGGVDMHEILFRPILEGQKPSGAILPVRDDKGILNYPTYLGFDVMR